MPSINSARYAQRIIQTESHESPSFLRKVHRLDPPPDEALLRPRRQFGSATLDFFEPWRLAILLRFVTRMSPLVAFSARVSEL